MEIPFIPKNSNLQILFEKLYECEIYTKKNTHQIYEFLLDSILTV